MTSDYRNYTRDGSQTQEEGRSTTQGTKMKITTKMKIYHGGRGYPSQEGTGQPCKGESYI